MPQVDLETLVSVCGGNGNDRKIACETLSDGEKGLQEKPEVPDDDADVPPDFPPESFWLSKDAELDWFDRNAFYERKESTKGNSNSTNLNPSSNSSSQRFSMNFKSKASIIGLPKTQKTSYVDSKRRNCKQANIRLFPKRSESVGKSAVQVTEPSSPKVSCMGRVRSKRGRRRSTQPARETAKPVVRVRSGSRRRTGFLSGFMSIFRSSRPRREEPVVERNNPQVYAESPPRKSVTVKVREFPATDQPVAEPPGLGAMKRFSSGRRSESWSTDDFDVVKSDSLDSESPAVPAKGGPTGCDGAVSSLDGSYNRVRGADVAR